MHFAFYFKDMTCVTSAKYLDIKKIEECTESRRDAFPN